MMMGLSRMNCIEISFYNVFFITRNIVAFFIIREHKCYVVVN